VPLPGLFVSVLSLVTAASATPAAEKAGYFELVPIFSGGPIRFLPDFQPLTAFQSLQRSIFGLI